jgi:Domain of unknown function (DUF4347)/Bacterial pre-peptidase C-terminal domain
MSLQPLTSEPQFSSAQDYSRFNLRGLLDDPAGLDSFGVEVGKSMGIAFVDPTVPDYQSLIQGINPGTQVVVLDANQDGVKQITDFLLKDALIGGKYSAVHIISHGSPGSIQIGSSHLGHDNIINYAGGLQQWQNALTADADILLYGCDVANLPASEKDFLQHLAELTGADVAASDNKTGSAALGGDWTLEFKTGAIETSLPFKSVELAAYNHTLNNGIIINEFRRTTGTFVNSEYIEFLLTTDQTAAQLESLFFGDSSSTTIAKFGTYKFTNLANIASTFRAGTIIVVGGTTAIPSPETTYNPVPGGTDGDWNILLTTGGGFVNNVSGSGDFATSDVAWVDTSANGTTSIHSINWHVTPGAFGAVATVTIASPTGSGSSGNVEFQGNNTQISNAASYTVNSAGSLGLPNGGTNVTYINSLRNPASTVSIAASASNTTEGGVPGIFTISRGTATNGNLTVNFTIDASSTASSSDYNLSGGNVNIVGSNVTVTIPDGASFVNVNLAAIAEALGAAEVAETLRLNLSAGTGYTVDSINNNATVTITANGTVVTTTDDSTTTYKEGSLRQAILNANAFSGTDTISFNIVGTGVQAIAPVSTLPTITDSVIIDGTTQPGFSGTPLIELNGSNAGIANGLKITAGNSTVKGLIINRFNDNGIELNGGGGNIIQGNYIGTNANGTVDQGNTNAGVYISNSPNNTIGGTTSAARNIISGNDRSGIYIQGSGATGTQIQGNYLGTNVTGNGSLGNSSSGVEIENAPNNTIGGTIAGARNLISGNILAGVRISGTGATNNLVQGNYIGTDITGTLDIGSNFEGILIAYAPNNIIGGTTAEARNIISGNNRYGVWINGNTSIGNQVIGNYIGTKIDGISSLGNSSHGVLVDFGATNNVIGGTLNGAGNAIAFNGGDGVYVNDNASLRNRILANSIFSNADLGIDLFANGLTTNDSGDGDTGANNLQNFPEFSTLTKSGSNLNITYKVPSTTTNSAYPIRVEFFIADSSGEGKTFLGFDTYDTANANANKTISFTPTGTVNIGDKIVATATDNNGNTSEFSIEQTVTLANTAPILDLNGAASSINYNTTFTRGGSAVAIVDTSNLALTDDGTTLNSATVRITNLLNSSSEILSAVTSGTNINANYNNGILALTGSDTVTNYQQVLRSITYNNTALIPNTTTRNIEFVVSDGSLNSVVATTALAINMPTISLGSNITAGTRSRPPVASLNNTTSEVLYSFNLTTASRVVANLMMNGGNADLALLDSNGTVLASSIRGGTLAENFDRAGLSAGQYFIRVYRVDPGTTVNYQLSVNFA